MCCSVHNKLLLFIFVTLVAAVNMTRAIHGLTLPEICAD